MRRNDPNLPPCAGRESESPKMESLTLGHLKPEDRLLSSMSGRALIQQTLHFKSNMWVKHLLISSNTGQIKTREITTIIQLAVCKLHITLYYNTRCSREAGQYNEPRQSLHHEGHAWDSIATHSKRMIDNDIERYESCDEIVLYFDFRS